MNLKKIGLTALAGSLVATSVYAGELAVSGSASMKVVHVNGGAANTGKSWSMGNSVTFSGGGELDNGMTVAVSFELDQGAANNSAVTSTGTVAANSGAVFDSHSVTVSSDALGALTFAGHGGSSAQSAIDTTAAGDLWDSTFMAAGVKPKASATSNNMISYTLPSVVDGVALALSYVPTSSAVKASSTAYSIAYTGVEGLAVHYASGEDNGTTGSTADVDTIKATYAYGPISVGYSSTEYDNENTGADQDQDVESYNISYTVSENISLSYGSETISEPNDTDDQDIEISGIKASYTTGGMTISGAMIDADNTAMGTATTEDKQHWNLAASFAF
jgi:outer membrane protein OmpU